MSKLKIGWAERDITPYGPIYIPGHFNMRISEGVIDPISTTALVVDGGEDIAIFLSVDCVVIRSFLLDEIRGKVKQKNPEIPVEKILAGATHAHTTPSHYYDGGDLDESIKEMGYTDDELQKLVDGYIPTSQIGVPRDGMDIDSSDEYRSFLSDKAAEAICEAYRSRNAGGLTYGYGYAVVAHSRRSVYFDDLSKRPNTQLNSLTSLHGNAMMYGNPDDDNFSHYEAGADHFLNVMYTFDSSDKLTGAIINIPCPSQNSEGEANRRITADFWHDIRTSLRKQYKDIFVLAQCAAGGDLSPRILHYKKAQQRRFNLKYGAAINGKVEEYARRDIAERVTAAFNEILDWASKDIKTDVTVRHAVETVELSRRIITDEEYAFAEKELSALEKLEYRFDLGSPKANLDHNSTLKSKRNRFMNIIKRYNIQKEQPNLPMELHAIRIDDICFASNRFEMYMDYQHRIQARSPFSQTFVVQLAGQPGMEGGSYLATERAVWGRGYSASMFCNQVSCDGGQQLVNETLRILNTLAD